MMPPDLKKTDEAARERLQLDCEHPSVGLRPLGEPEDKLSVQLRQVKGTVAFDVNR